MLYSFYKTAYSSLIRNGFGISEKSMDFAVEQSLHDIFKKHIELGIKPNTKHLNNAIQNNSALMVAEILKSLEPSNTLNLTEALKATHAVKDVIVRHLIKNNQIPELEKFYQAGFKFNSAHLTLPCTFETFEWLNAHETKYDRTTLRHALRHAEHKKLEAVIASGVSVERVDITSVFDEKNTPYGAVISPEIRSKMATILVKCTTKLENDDLMKALNLGNEELTLLMLEKLENFRPDKNILNYAALRGFDKLLDEFIARGTQLNLETLAILYQKDENLYKKHAHKTNAVDEFQVVKKLCEKGNYSAAKKLLSTLENTSVFRSLEMLSDSLLMNFDDNIEFNKWPALLNLLSKSVKLNTAQKALLGKSSYFNSAEFSALKAMNFRNYQFTYGLIHKLAEHHIHVTKELLKQEITSDNYRLLDTIFSDTATLNQKFQAALAIKVNNPNSTSFAKVDSAFDLIYLTVGEPLSRINHLYSLEVLSTAGIYPKPQEQNLRVYRGMMANLSDDDLKDFFKYGLHSFSPGYFQKNLGFYYASNLGETFSGRTQPHYELGGVYVSVEPRHSVQYALGRTTNNPNTRRLFFECVLKSGSPQIFGFSPNEYELAPAQINADEVLSIYELNENGVVVRRIDNPNFFSALVQPSFELGQIIERNENAVNLFEQIYSPLLAPHESFISGREFNPLEIEPFYNQYPELPNQVSAAPKALSEVRLDQDVYAFQCLDDRFTQFVMHSSLPEVKALRPAPLPIMPDSGTAIVRATPKTSTALQEVQHSIKNDEIVIPAALQTYDMIGAIQHTTATVRLAQCVWRGAEQFAEYFTGVAQSISSTKVEHKYVRQLQENAAEVLRFIKKVGKDLDQKDPQNIEAFTEEAHKLERKINGRTSFSQKEMSKLIEEIKELYEEAKSSSKDSKSRSSRLSTAAQNLEQLSEEIYQCYSR